MREFEGHSRTCPRASLEVKMEDTIGTQPVIYKLIAEIKRNDHAREDPFEQAYHDEIAANSSLILELINGEIALIVDKNDELIASLISKPLPDIIL
jgi:hypothetical protein